jgi:hypothetical protein
MANGKILFRLGPVHFSGEGEEQWVAAQLDKVLERAPALLQTAPPALPPKDRDRASGSNGDGSENSSAAGGTITLAKFLQQKNAGSKQVSRFLATSEWLMTMRGMKKLSTKDVTKALKDNHQSRLSNPADCLNKNVTKGYCEKDGTQFSVTPEGRQSLE